MFQRNTILRTANNSINFLIVDVNFPHEKIAFYDLNDLGAPRKERSAEKKKKSVRPPRTQRKPSFSSFKDFSSAVDSFNYQVERLDVAAGVYVPANVSLKRRETFIRTREVVRDENYGLIKEIVEDPDKTYEYLYTDRGQQHIRAINNRTGVHPAHISRLLAQYFSRGRSSNAMLPNYQFCGCNFQLAVEVTDTSKKKGRPSIYTCFRNRLPADELNIKSFLKKLGKKKFKRWSYSQQYRMYDYFYQSEDVHVDAGDKSSAVRRVPLLESNCISYAQYYFYVKRLEVDRDFYFQEKGDKAFLLEYENRLGRARDGVCGPSFRYEIDATVEDVYLLFPYFLEQRLSCGRPTVYRVSDVYSKMTVGIYVGFGGPNWEGALQALYNAFTDKVEFCKQFDVLIEDWQWPCAVTCNELTIDNGVEYPKENIKQLLEEQFGVDCINYTAIYSGRSKGGVEGGFETDKKEAVQFMPGYVERMPERGSVHASRYSSYTYNQFMKLLIVQTMMRNNEVYRQSGHDQVMSEVGVGATALDVWNFGMAHYMNGGRGKKFRKEQILFGLLPAGTASTTSRGIKFKGLYYTCNYAKGRGWLADEASRPVKELDIRYFQASTECIWYRHEGNIYTASLSTHSEVYKNRSWYEALHRLELYKAEKVVQGRKERDARIEQTKITQDLLDEAKQRLAGTPSASSKSPSKQTSIIAYVQKQMQRTETAALFRSVLSGNDDGHLEISSGLVKIPAKSKVKNKMITDMYGDRS
ncbi:MAG: hypothetical protein WA173_18700 [Pseudomonas sp.]|uniref:hypothetical protein n=1 Tax=Pseudomonas sp. TaxID=306 RepID=UPI003BB54E61